MEKEMEEGHWISISKHNKALDDQKAKIIEIVEKTGEDDMLKDYNGVYINFVKIGIRLYKAKVVNNILKEFEEL